MKALLSLTGLLRDDGGFKCGGGVKASMKPQACHLMPTDMERAFLLTEAVGRRRRHRIALFPFSTANEPPNSQPSPRYMGTTVLGTTTTKKNY